MAFRLVTTWHRSENEQRQQELDACLDTNCWMFDSVSVLAESAPCPEWFTGTHWFEGMERQKFSDLLALAGISKSEDVVVIANSDITFSEPSEPLNYEQIHRVANNLRTEQVYCLSRWDITPSGIKHFDERSSQDAWIFRGAPKPNIGGDYHIGYPGTDNRFAHELDAAGYQVLNPSKDIRTYHLHQSGHRPGNQPQNRIGLPYLFIKPAHLGEEPEYFRPEKASKRASAYQK